MSFLTKWLGKPTREDFAEEFVNALQNAGIGESLEYDPGQFTITYGDNILFLENAYKDYCATPRRHRSDVIQKYVAADQERGEEVPEHFEVGLDRYFPHLRSQAFFSMSDLLFRSRGIQSKFDSAFLSFCGDLCTSLVYDRPNSVQSITATMLKDWGRSFEDALSVAQNNLFQATSGPLIEVTKGLYTAPWEDIYNGTRILLPHLFEDLKLPGNPVALVPTRETLLVVGSEDAQCLIKAAEFAREASQSGRRLSAVPLVLENGAWKNFELPIAHPAYNIFRRARTLELAMDYEGQQSVLQQVEGEEFYVSNLMLAENKATGELCSYSVWSEGIKSLLPASEFISFAKQNGTVQTYKWKDVHRIFGSLMQPCGLHPERYRIIDFPDVSSARELIPVD